MAASWRTFQIKRRAPFMAEDAGLVKVKELNERIDNLRRYL
jgi:hypothetical protein